MKSKLFLMAVCLLTTVFVYAQKSKPVTEKIKVYGNCTQCKNRVENALDVKGIKSAEWNIDTKMLEVIYVPGKISSEQIHKIVASVGHDTDKEKAPDSVYLKLPDCCMYRDNPNTHHD